MDLVQPVMDDELWDVETLQRLLECYTCSVQVYNPWLICTRKFAEINLHPEYLSRMRQWWYVAMLPLKFLILPDEYTGLIVKFKGMFTPRVLEMTSKDPAVPIKLRKSKVVAFGELFFIYISQRGKHL